MDPQAVDLYDAEILQPSRPSLIVATLPPSMAWIDGRTGGGRL
jgi:hypothetical protein